MSFFKKLFGRGQAGASGSWEEPLQTVEHEGFKIEATPMKEGSQYRLAGTISRQVGDELKEHKLIRADLFTSAEECASFTITKAKQVIKEQGERMFG